MSVQRRDAEAQREANDQIETCRTSWSLLWLFLLAVVSAGGQTAPSTAVPSRPAADRNAFTFTNYNLNITIEPARQLFTSRGTVMLRNDSAAAQHGVALQISSSLKWAAVHVAGKPIEFASTKIESDIDHTGAVNEATFQLPEPLAPGASVEIEVAYQGTIAQEATRLGHLGMPLDIARASDWDRISETFTALRGIGHVVWYPVSIEPATLEQRNRVFELLGQWRGRNAESAMRLTLNVIQADGNRSPEVFSNGRVDSESMGGAQRLNITFPRLGLDGPLLVIGNYVPITNAAGTVLATSKDQPAAYAAAAAKLLPTVAQWLRAPQRKIQVIQNPEANAAPFESGTVLLTPFLTEKKAVELQLTHTLAHAAVYSFRPWISEGLAHYAQARMREVQDGRKAALAYLEQRRAALALAEPDEPKDSDPARSLINTTDEIFYRTKAMYAWWMLHDLIGDDPIVKALQAYKPEEDKEPSYVQRLIEAQAHRNLEWFFTDWIYRDRGLPDFRITAVYPRQSLKGGFLVTVTVENLGSAGAEVPIRLVTTEGEVITRLEVMAKEKASARVNMPIAPVEVIVNDGSVPESDPTNNTFTVEAPKQ